jgi:hypothetical protein
MLVHSSMTVPPAVRSLHQSRETVACSALTAASPVRPSKATWLVAAAAVSPSNSFKPNPLRSSQAIAG